MHLADHATWMRTAIVEHSEMAKDTYRVRISCPAIATSSLPGQFVMIRIANCNDPLIGRALAVYDRYRDAQGTLLGIDLIYVAKGKFTQRLCKLGVGAEVEVWGPLGNAFSTEKVDHLIMVAGGVGETPMLCLGREALGLEQFGANICDVSKRDRSARTSGYAEKVTLCYGARNAAYLAAVDVFRSSGIDVRLSTDDGSAGAKQLVTATLEQVLNEESGSARIACCGPEPMMQAVTAIAVARGIPCEVSLETPMACGIGICFTCVAKVKQADESWDYKRTCVEGPIFDAASLVW